MPNSTVLTQAEIHTASYAEKSKSTNFPKREQAIVLPSLDNTKIEEYLYAVGSIVHPKNILAASRISQNRICVYLSSIQVANEFVQNHAEISIQNQKIKVRKLITPTKRIVLSNVSPHLPHHVLEKALITCGLKLMSPISCIKYNVANEEYKHICSFRRLVFCAVDPDANFSMPESLIIEFEGESSRIYLTDDSIYCANCKTHEHLTSKCTVKNHSNPPKNTHIPENTEGENSLSSDITELADVEIADNAITTDIMQSNSNGPSLSTTSSRCSSETQITPSVINNPSLPSPRSSKLPPVNQPTKRDLSTSPRADNKALSTSVPAKKLKADEPDIANLKKFLQPVSETIQNQFKTVGGAFSFNQIIQIISASKQFDTIDAISRHTNIPIENVDVLGTQLRLMHDSTQDRSTMIRITKLLKKLTPKNGDNTMEHSGLLQ